MIGFEPIHGVQSRVVFLATLIAFVCMMSLATVPASFLADDSAAVNHGAAISDHADSGTTGKYMLAKSTLSKFFYRLGDKLGLYNGKRSVTLFNPNTGTYVTKKVWKYDASDVKQDWNAAHPYDACSADADCNDGNPATLDTCIDGSGVWYCTHAACTPQTFYRDYDGDGYGDPAVSLTECIAPNGYVTNSGDCDDNNAELKPGAPEILDGADNDCNGIIDDIVCSNETQFLGSNFQITTTNLVLYEDVAFGKDKYLVAFDYNFTNLYGQFVSTNGSNIGSLFNISSVPYSGAPSVAYNNDSGRWMVAWLDTRPGTSATGIYGRIFEDNGTPIGSDFLIYDGPFQDQYQWVTAIPSGFFVAYEVENATGNVHVYANRISNNGVVGPQIMITNAEEGQMKPSAVYAAESDRILVTWYDYRNMNEGTDSDIYGQLLDGSGNLIGENFMIYDGENYQTTSRVAYNSIDNTFLVIFDDQTDYSGGKRISAQKVALNGSLIGKPVIVSDTDGGEEFPAIAYNSNVDKYMGVWTDCGDVYAQIFDSYSLPLGADLVLSNAPDDQCYISVTRGPGSTFLAIWFDKRTGHSEVWGQIISAPCEEVCSNLTYYKDADGDGYGDAGSTKETCGVPEGYVSNDGDCDDGDDSIYPDATELCDGIDNNCNSEIDEGLDWIGMSGGNFQITTDINRDGAGRVAFGDNKYLVVWSSNRTGANRNLFGQFIGADGSILGSDFAISQYDAFQQMAAVKYNPYSEKWLVVWNDARVEGDVLLGDLYGRLMNKDGSFAGDYFVISAMPDAQIMPTIAALPGKFLVAWEDWRECETTGCDNDIYARMIDSSGTLLGSEIVISNETDSIESAPDAVYDPVNDRVLVSWEDWRNQFTTGADIYARFIGSDGAYIGGQFVANDDPGNQQTPSIAYNSEDKNYLVANDGITDSTRNIRAQKLAIDGAKEGASYQVNDGALMNWGDQNVKIAYNQVISKYLMVWADNESSPENGSMEIFGQFANGDGTKDETNIFVTISPNSQSSPAIAAGPGQDFLVLWADDRDGGSPDIWGQRVQGSCEYNPT